MFRCLPNDSLIHDMDPIVKVWMFYNWLEDQNDDVDLAKNHAYLVGSFINPEAVEKLTGAGSHVHTSSDEEFEASTRMILNKKDEDGRKVKRRRRKLKE